MDALKFRGRRDLRMNVVNSDLSGHGIRSRGAVPSQECDRNCVALQEINNAARGGADLIT